MPKQIKLRRGTTAQHATFIGAQGEITVDTTKKTIVVHDGATAGGVPLAPEAAQIIKTGNLVWVDGVNGNDVTAQRGRLQLPFLTLGAAKNAAANGDTIMVLPGVYNEKNLAKNMVNWHFYNGARININSAATGSIFDTGASGGACTFNITGHGQISVISEPFPEAVINSAYASDVIGVECASILANGEAFRIAGKLFAHVNTISSASANCISISGNQSSQIYADTISSAANAAVSAGGGNVSVNARWICSTGNMAVYSTGTASMRVTSDIITSSALHGVVIASANATCHIIGAKITSAAGAVGHAAFVATGNGLSLTRCSLVSTAPATKCIESNGATNVLLYGDCTANLPVGASITTIGGNLIVNANLT